MRNVFRSKAERIILVPIELFAFLVPFASLLGWSLFSAVFFWFIVIPALAFGIPCWLCNQKIQLGESLVGLIVFYATMIFLIHKHYQTDLFQVMMVSLLSNLAVFAIVKVVQRKATFSAALE
jgi:hypothetical protein